MAAWNLADTNCFKKRGFLMNHERALIKTSMCGIQDSSRHQQRYGTNTHKGDEECVVNLRPTVTSWPLKRHNQANIIEKSVFLCWLFNMTICPWTRIAEYFGLLWQRIASVAKALFISYSSISYFGHVCPKLNSSLFLA